MWIAVSVFTGHITTNVLTLCWNKTSPSFSGAHSSCIALSINTILVPQIGMYMISYISIFGAIVSHLVRGDICLTDPEKQGYSIEATTGLIKISRQLDQMAWIWPSFTICPLSYYAKMYKYTVLNIWLGTNCFEWCVDLSSDVIS